MLQPLQRPGRRAHSGAAAGARSDAAQCLAWKGKGEEGRVTLHSHGEFQRYYCCLNTSLGSSRSCLFSYVNHM